MNVLARKAFTRRAITLEMTKMIETFSFMPVSFTGAQLRKTMKKRCRKEKLSPAFAPNFLHWNITGDLVSLRL